MNNGRKNIVSGLGLTLLTCACLFCQVAFAKTTAWQGPSAAAWSVGTWSNGRPESGDTVVLADIDGVNDLDLTDISLQFVGTAGCSLTGNAIALAGGESAVVVSGTGVYVVGVPLALAEGDNGVSVAAQATIRFAGVLSGAGRLVLKGANESGLKNYELYRGAASWPSVVELTAANEYEGGTYAEKVAVVVANAKAFGRQWSTVEYKRYGWIKFTCGGDVDYHFYPNTETFWMMFAGSSANINGDIANESQNVAFGVLGKEANYLDVHFYGTVNLPKGSLENAGENVRSHFHKPLTIKSVTGNGGAISKPAEMHCLAATNMIQSVNMSAMAHFYFDAADSIVPTMTVGCANYAASSRFDISGHDATIAALTSTITSDAYKTKDYRRVNSDAAATLTVTGDDQAFSYGKFTGAISLDWAPADDRTYVLTNVDFASSGTLTVSRGTVRVVGDCAFSADGSVRVDSGASLDLENGTEYVVRTLVVGNRFVPPGETVSFGAGSMTPTAYEPPLAVWTAGGETDLDSDAGNWGEALPDFAVTRLLFGSAGETATLTPGRQVEGLAFGGGSGSFALSGTGPLHVGFGAVTVADGFIATMEVPCAFSEPSVAVEVGAGGVLVTRAAVASATDGRVTKRGSGTWRIEAVDALADVDNLVLADGALAFADSETAVTRTVTSLSVEGGARISIGENVTLTVEEDLAIGLGGSLAITASSVAQVRCPALANTVGDRRLTVNGMTVAFGADGTAASDGYAGGTEIAAHGGVIPNAPGENVRISTDGEGDDPVSLAGDSVTVGALAQATAADATVSFAGQTLGLGTLVRLEDAGALTIGAADREGTLTAAGGTLYLENRDTAADLTIRSAFAPGEAVVVKRGRGMTALPASGIQATVRIENGGIGFGVRPQVSLSNGGTVPEVSVVGASQLGLTNRVGDLIIGGSGDLSLGSLVVRPGARTTICEGARVTFDPATGVQGIAGELTVTNATLVAFDATSPLVYGNRFGRALNPGFQGDGVLRVQAGSVVTNRLMVGHARTVGAAYFEGGRTVLVGSDVNVSGNENGMIRFGYGNGYDAHGYTEVRSGAELVTLNSVQVGTDPAATVVSVLGGTMTATNYPGAVENGSYFAFSSSSRPTELFVREGTFVSHDRGQMMDRGTGQAVLTVATNGVMRFAANPLYVGHASNRDNTKGTVINVMDGGLFDFYGISANQTYFPTYATNAVGERVYRPVYINANGGRLHRNRDQNSTTVFGERGGCPYVSRITVFEKGLTFSTRRYQQVRQPFLAPTGKGVAGIPWTVRTGMIAAPAVWIEGDGWGATAHAEFDSRTGSVTNLLVTSPGCDYTTATAHVYLGAEEIATIPCQLADNVRTGAVRFAGDEDMYNVTLWPDHGPWTVGEVVLDRSPAFRLVQSGDDVLSTNTIVTLNAADNYFTAYDSISTGNRYRMQAKMIRGTAGVVNGAADGYVHVRALAPEGTGAINFSGLTNRVEGVWEIDLADFAERRNAGICGSDVVVAPDARIRLLSTEVLEGQTGSFDLARVAAGKTLTVPAEVLAAVEGLPQGWRLTVKGNRLRLSTGGLVLIVR